MRLNGGQGAQIGTRGLWCETFDAYDRAEKEFDLIRPITGVDLHAEHGRKRTLIAEAAFETGGEYPQSADKSVLRLVFARQVQAFQSLIIPITEQALQVELLVEQRNIHNEASLFILLDVVINPYLADCIVGGCPAASVGRIADERTSFRSGRIA